MRSDGPAPTPRGSLASCVTQAVLQGWGLGCKSWGLKCALPSPALASCPERLARSGSRQDNRSSGCVSSRRQLGSDGRRKWARMGSGHFSSCAGEGRQGSASLPKGWIQGQDELKGTLTGVLGLVCTEHLHWRSCISPGVTNPLSPPHPPRRAGAMEEFC